MELIARFKPDCMAIEKLFFNKNTRTAMIVGEAMGVILLAAAMNDLPVSEYTPLQIKMTLSGYGRATKEQVNFMVRELLELEAPPRPDDAADALACALTHLALKDDE